MGTRSLTFVYEKYGQIQKPVVNMYRQYDGYPEGHGTELAEFLSGGQLVNGLGVERNNLQFNGMGCLAAQMVSFFKKTSGGFYIHPVDVTDCGQDYEYHIYDSGKGLYVEVVDCGCNMFGLTMSDKHDFIFKGNRKEFTKFCKDEDGGELDFGSIDELKSILVEDTVVVNFTKNDGSNRVMRCTLNPKLIPESTSVKSTNTKTVRYNSGEVLPVFDLDANGWRSFRYDSINSVEKETV